MVQLDIISDPICPWCYIGKAQLDRAIAQVGVNPFSVQWRIFQLNPWMPAEGMDRKLYLETKFGGAEQAAAIYARIEAAAADAGVEVDFSRIARTPNTMDAHRLILWSRTTGAQQLVVDRLFQAYFRDGTDISDHDVLLEIAEAAGMEGKVVAELLSGDADRAALAEEDEEARRRGVTGVPCFVVGGKYVVQGAQPAETWSRIIAELAQAMTERTEEAHP